MHVYHFYRSWGRGRGGIHLSVCLSHMWFPLKENHLKFICWRTGTIKGRSCLIVYLNNFSILELTTKHVLWMESVAWFSQIQYFHCFYFLNFSWVQRKVWHILLQQPLLMHCGICGLRWKERYSQTYGKDKLFSLYKISIVMFTACCISNVVFFLRGGGGCMLNAIY